MPHDHVRLAQAPNGEIGPRCSMCNKRMTFGAAMVLNNNYVCWPCYVEAPVPTPQRWSGKPWSVSTPAEAWVQAVSSPPDVRWTAGRASRIVSAATTVALSFGNPPLVEGNGCSSRLVKALPLRHQSFSRWRTSARFCFNAQRTPVSIQPRIGNGRLRQDGRQTMAWGRPDFRPDGDHLRASQTGTSRGCSN